MAGTNVCVELGTLASQVANFWAPIKSYQRVDSLKVVNARQGGHVVTIR